MASIFAPSDQMDYIALVMVLIEILYVSLITISLLLKKTRNYPPVLFQDKRNLSFMMASGVVHSICALLTNEHFHIIETYNSTILCIFISIFIQYGLAVNTFIICIIFRMIKYGTFFSPKIFSISRRGRDDDIEMITLTSNSDYYQLENSKNLYYNYERLLKSVPIVFALPFIIYPIVNFKNESMCKVDTITKYLIGLWCFICIIVIIFINQRLTKIKFVSEMFHQYKPINTILFLGSITLTINAIVQIYSLWEVVDLRLAATLSISILHITAVHVLIGKRIYHALIEDYDYCFRFIRSHEWIRRTPISSLDRANEIPDFIIYCKNNYKMSDYQDSVLTLSIITYLMISLQIINEEAKPFINSSDTKEFKERVKDNYFSYDSNQNIAVILANYLYDRVPPEKAKLLAMNPVSEVRKMSEIDKSTLDSNILNYLDEQFGAAYDSQLQLKGTNVINRFYQKTSIPILKEAKYRVDLGIVMDTVD